MMTAMAIAIVASTVSSASADDVQQNVKAAPAADQVVVATQTTDSKADQNKVTTVSGRYVQAQQPCPRCGKVHGAAAPAPVVRQQRSQSMFDQVMELERRKNAWLLSLVR
jgi:uncharacterized protein YcbX